MSTASLVPSVLGAALTAGVVAGAEQLLASFCASASGQPQPKPASFSG
ncbi:hypothetical protein [Nocardia stercoris]|nr:hypothetical protein [Nocardia stercoris]